MSDVTRLLDAIQHGDPKAAEELLPLVYKELRQLAAAKMARENPGHTLQPTALVHEAWLKLAGPDGRAQFQNRAHFFGAAAEAMRRILVDSARRKLAARHGGGQSREDIAGLEIAAPSGDDELLAVHDALEKFAALDPQKAELVKLRYFVGLPFSEVAEVLGISEPTAKRWWAYARAWLHTEVAAGH
ncbi:MAG: sigma-70 family RNA polymerase sigma factor [Verrucomicrobia bacterium]|nr:sigma-70 family RNA polymerase sigma factor [Verrucomicrobiota bacterium]